MTEETGDGLAGRERGKEWMKNKSRVEEARRDERRQSENGAERFCWSSSLLLSRLMLSCHFQELIGTSSVKTQACVLVLTEYCTNMSTHKNISVTANKNYFK